MNCPSCGQTVPEGFRFCGQCGAKLDAGTAPAAVAEPDPPPAPRDERREVAVLFADVSGFTAMSERLDPEAVHAIMNRCFAGLGKAIHDEGGFIDKYIGDNVMALFGAPMAHEDDPARACRAALAMQRFLDAFADELRGESGLTLRMRIGINHGICVAGRVGSEGRMDYTVMGDTVNLAARLEAAAPPGGTLVSAEIRRRTFAHFEFGDAQRLTVKGKREPVWAYPLLGERWAAVGTAEPRRVRLIGRERELAALLDRLGTPAAANPWIDVRGEMGVGKTRLAQEVGHRLAPRPLLRVEATEAACRRPFGLARRVIHEVLAMLSGGPDRPILDNLESFASAMRALCPDLEPYRPALWYVAAPSRVPVPAPDPDPQAMRRTVERGIAAMADAAAGKWPGIVLWLDGYQHADEASAALLESLGGGNGWPMPVLATSRPDGARPPTDPDRLLRIEPLAEADAAALLDDLLEGRATPASVRAAVLRRAAGVPLFIEALAQELIDRGAIVPEQAGDLLDELPSSLRSAMVAKLDRLRRDPRELLSQCSVQGVEFDLDVAEHVRRDPPWRGPPVADMLGPLERSRVICPDRGERRRAFRLPLFQEACYETLLKRDRRALHGRIAAALVHLAGGSDHVSAELLMEHHERAQQWREAAEAQLRAADRAASLFLNDKALAGYDHAAELAARFEAEAQRPAADDRDGDAITAVRRIAALADGGAARVLIRVGRYTAARQRATAMAERAPGPGERAEGWRLIATVCERTGRTDEAEALLRRVIGSDAAEVCPDADVVSRAWYDLGHLRQRAGELDEAIDCLERCRAMACSDRTVTLIRADLLEGMIEHTRGRFQRAAELYRQSCDRARALGALAQEARASNDLGNAARDQGHYTDAASHYEHALELYTRMGDSECMAGVRNNLGNLAMSRGRFEDAGDHYGRSLEASERMGNVHGIATAHANLAMLAVERGDAATAIASARAALAALGSAGNNVLRALVMVVLGDGQRLAGGLDDAEQTFEHVLAHYDQQPLAVATAERGLGRIAAARGRWDDARRELSRAADRFARLSRSQEEHRTRLDLAEALQSCGESDAALEQALRAAEALAAMDARHDADRAAALLARIDGRGSAPA